MTYSHLDKMMACSLDDFYKQTGLRLVDCNVDLYSAIDSVTLLGVDLRFNVLNNGCPSFSCGPEEFKNISDVLLMAIYMQKFVGVDNLEESELITRLMKENFELRKKLGEAGDDLTLEEE